MPCKRQSSITKEVARPEIPSEKNSKTMFVVQWNLKSPRENERNLRRPKTMKITSQVSWNQNCRNAKAESCSGEIVKDDSGAYADFIEQCSSASQMTAAKIVDVIAILPDCVTDKTADAVSAYTQVK